jgi:hypothetical protein
MKNRSALFIVALTAVAAVVLAYGYAAAGTPTPASDNPSCADHGFLQLTKFDPPPSSGTDSQEGVTISITGSDGDQATEFSWSSTTAIDLVIVKAGDGANVYPYEEVIADTGLFGPANKGIGHISFCYDPESPSPSPPPDPSPDPSPEPPFPSPSPPPSPSAIPSPSP